MMLPREFELGKSAEILTKEFLKLGLDETCIITADTESDSRVIEATARAAFVAGAKPMVIWLATPLGEGKAADPMLPVGALSAALKQADVWIEFNNKFLLYSTPHETALRENPKLRYLCLSGVNVETMTTCIGNFARNLSNLREFMKTLADLTRNGRSMKITTAKGTDVEFENDQSIPTRCHMGYYDKPGTHMLPGQIGWTPKFSTIRGIIAFDGSVYPLGLLKEPIKLHVEEGKIVAIEGGTEALKFEAWLKQFNDPNMFRMAHLCYGLNPGAKLTGNMIEDERVWGCTEWGMGYVSPRRAPPQGIPAVSHSDGICLDSSVWIDETRVLDRGRFVHESLADLAKTIMDRPLGGHR